MEKHLEIIRKYMETHNTLEWVDLWDRENVELRRSVETLLMYELFSELEQATGLSRKTIRSWYREWQDLLANEVSEDRRSIQFIRLKEIRELLMDAQADYENSSSLSEKGKAWDRRLRALQELSKLDGSYAPVKSASINVGINADNNMMIEELGLTLRRELANARTDAEKSFVAGLIARFYSSGEVIEGSTSGTTVHLLPAEVGREGI